MTMSSLPSSLPGSLCIQFVGAGTRSASMFYFMPSRFLALGECWLLLPTSEIITTIYKYLGFPQLRGINHTAIKERLEKTFS